MSVRRYLKGRGLAVAVWLVAATAGAQSDPYEQYVKTSKDFQPVRLDAAFVNKMYPSWVFMPWYYQWSIGFDDAAGAFCKQTGINGGFTDRGNAANLEWFNKHGLRFYMDHTAGKGDLHLWDKWPKDKANEVHGTGVRFRPVNAAMKTKLEGIIKSSIAAVKSSPMRAAYALDDEISWGHFVHPTMWQVTDDAFAYPAWLNEIYGDQAPARSGWIGYNDILPKLSSWSLASFDASPLMDQWSFNDSYWNNFLGDLVAYANSIDPAVPVGYVGGQCPNAFGGFDYAKTMRKVQYIEAYNMAGVQAIIRSFNPGNSMPTVTTFFYNKDAGLADAEWQTWYYLAQGNRGHIAWVENWFDGKQPREWLTKIAPTYTEASQKIGPLMSGAEFRSDGVALYYSHASVQLGWILDAAAHGKTWINRNGDNTLGSSHLGRVAWMHMLRDEGVQFNWLSYVDLIQGGVPADVKVLILPAAICLSDAEARRIKAFCEKGGTVIADYMPGLWDQHGKGRAKGGALDDLFGVKHDPAMTAKDVFQGDGKLWVEVNQESHFYYKNYEEFLSRNNCIRHASGFNKAVRAMEAGNVNRAGSGSAALLNLSPQWYLAMRGAGPAEAAKRAVFMKPMRDAGIKRWVELKNVDAKTFGYEITYWTKGSRTILFLVANKDVKANSLGGGAASGLVTEVIPVTIAFGSSVSDVKDERAGKSLGNGKEFSLPWKLNEACVLSFESK
jgi:hypothetical protein